MKTDLSTTAELAVDHFGAGAQIERALESLSALALRLHQHKRGQSAKIEVCEAVAAANVALAQLRDIFGPADCDEWTLILTTRLAEQLAALTCTVPPSKRGSR